MTAYAARVLFLSGLLVCAMVSLGQEPFATLGEPERLHTGFKFTEGPASDGAGNLYFTDIPEEKIYKLDAEGQLSVFTDASRHANGLMFDAQGQLVACEMDGGLARWDVQTGERAVVVDEYGGARFNAPNDLVVDRTGGVYFTDPHYRSPRPLPQGKMGVYYVSPDGEATRLLDDLPTPNGVILSPDEKTLYVFPSEDSTMRAYPVEAPGKLGEGRDFYEVASGGCDGVAVDVLGNLYLTTSAGVEVVSPEGERILLIELPEQPANVTFGGPENKTLYATARTSLYAAPMNVAGHQFAAGE